MREMKGKKPLRTNPSMHHLHQRSRLDPPCPLLRRIENASFPLLNMQEDVENNKSPEHCEGHVVESEVDGSWRP